MIRVLCLWLAERLEGNDRLQASSKLVKELVGPRFFMDAQAEGRAWGFLKVVEGCQGFWFALEVTESWAPWAFVKGGTKRVAVLELSGDANCSEALGSWERQPTAINSFHKGLHGQQVQQKSRQKGHDDKVSIDTHPHGTY